MRKRHELLKRSIAVKSNGRANVQAVSHLPPDSPAPASGRRGAAPLLVEYVVLNCFKVRTVGAEYISVPRTFPSIAFTSIWPPTVCVLLQSQRSPQATCDF